MDSVAKRRPVCLSLLSECARNAHRQNLIIIDSCGFALNMSAKQIASVMLFLGCTLVAAITAACSAPPLGTELPQSHTVPAVATATVEPPMPNQANWKECRDRQYGFALRVPPDWRSTTEEGRCVQFQKGTSALPHGVPEVDVFIRVSPARGSFPEDYPNSPGVQYTDHRQLEINSLPAVRARFRSSGPVPNWGVEYAVHKGTSVLSIYISQPSAEVETLFDEVVKTLRW